MPPGWRRRPTARRSGPGSSTSRTRCSARRWKTCASSPPDAAAGRAQESRYWKRAARRQQYWATVTDPTPILIDCDPGHDDATALLLALASPEVELLGVTTVHGNQTLEKTTANALRVLEFAGRGDIPVAAGSDRPLVRDLAVAGHVHGESGMDGPTLPPPSGAPIPRHAVDFLADTLLASDRPVTLIPTGPLTNVALVLHRQEVHERIERIVLMGGAIAEGNM